MLISTDHDAVDYEALVRNSKLVIDTRNATQHIPPDLKAKVVKA